MVGTAAPAMRAACEYRRPVWSITSEPLRSAPAQKFFPSAQKTITRQSGWSPRLSNVSASVVSTSRSK
jgi:hypothetical protein